MDMETVTVFLVRGMLTRAEAEMVCKELKTLVLIDSLVESCAVYTTDEKNVRALGAASGFPVLENGTGDRRFLRGIRGARIA